MQKSLKVKYLSPIRPRASSLLTSRGFFSSFVYVSIHAWKNSDCKILMKRVLTGRFFNRPTIKVSQDLLGKFLVRRKGRKIVSSMITEVEAYIGPYDRASHASRGMTKRTKIMFGKAGYWYVYLVYGMHYCLNIVTEKEGYPAAILIRSVEHTKGPGRVCRFFDITKTFNEKKSALRTGLWVENRGNKIPKSIVAREERIGVEYAGVWSKKLWRFLIKNQR